MSTSPLRLVCFGDLAPGKESSLCRAAILEQELGEQRKTNDRLQVQLHKARRELETLRQHFEGYYSQFRFRLVEGLYRRLRKWPLALPSLFWIIRRCRWVVERLRLWGGRHNALARCMDRLLFVDPPLHCLFRPDIRRSLREFMTQELSELCHRPLPVQPGQPDLGRWFQRYRPTPQLLRKLRARTWPDDAPTFTILVRVNQNPPEWLSQSLLSIAAQTYTKWEALVFVSADMIQPQPSPGLAAALELRGRQQPALARVRFHQGSLSSVLERAWGDYLCLLDHGDALEPQALQRFADVALNTGPDLLYSDAVQTGADLDHIEALCARPAFSYDYFLAHGYFDHLVAVKMQLLRQVGGFDSASEVDPDTDWVLRVLEAGRSVSHVSDILYRRRHRVHTGHGASMVESAAARRRAVARHLERLGLSAELVATDHPACLDVRWPVHSRGRTAIIIPTKDKHQVLRACIDSLEATVPSELFDLCIVDHESREPEAIAYLQKLGERHQVVPFKGPFNFSHIMNRAVARLMRPCASYLFLNNDVEAISPGWLEHMLGLVQRGDVGAVGALLLYPDQTVQHGGAIVGLHYAADHVLSKEWAFTEKSRRRAAASSGREMALLTCRDQSIVTAACLLVRADVFHQVGGFDGGFAVGFGDSDLCLRIKARGYKVLLDAQAVLVHHESLSRGKNPGGDPHLMDTQLFRARYLHLILTGDPHYSPLLSRQAGYELNPYARAMEQVRARTVNVVLPQLPAALTVQLPLRKSA